MNRKRTAAYCRVSTTSDTQDGSFETQCEYYEKIIKENPDLEFVGVYGDHGKSGRSMHGRKELNRLISDCEEGRIDLVLQTQKFCYVMEFKLDGTAEEALAQIEDKHYTLPFEQNGQKIIRIGMNFSKEMRNIDKVIIE
jgi:hypothetical protein